MAKFQSKQRMHFEGLDFELIRSKRRTLSLEVKQEGLLARAPVRMTLEDIYSFIRQKHRWIKKQLDALPTDVEPIHCKQGEKIPFLGGEVTLNFLGPHPERKNPDEVYCDIKIHKDKENDSEYLRRKVIEWYKEQANTYLQNTLPPYAKEMRVASSKLKSIKVREYKKRWGCCDSRGRLSFNWRLIMAPEAVFNYVIVHELAHCHVFDHSPKFWQVVEDTFPQWREQQEWLHSNGFHLYRL